MAPQLARDDFEPDDFEPDDFEPDSEYKIGDLVGDTEPSPVNLGSLAPKKSKSVSTPKEAVKQAPKNVQYKGGLVSELYLKDNPDRIPGIGRDDERLTNVPDLIGPAVQRLSDRVVMSDYVPEWFKPLAASGIALGGYSAEVIAEMANDPTSPAFGLIGGLKKAITRNAADKKLADEIVSARALAEREKLTVPAGLEVQPQKVGTPQYNTAQFGLHPSDETLPYPLNVAPNRLRPPSTNATVFDALLPERLKYNEQGAAQRLTTEIVPPVVRPERLPSDITFNGLTREQIDRLPSGQPVKQEFPFRKGLELKAPIPVQPGTYGSHHVAVAPSDFMELAEAQRDIPESVMTAAQHKMGGGVLSNAIEHVGDLIHRMNERATFSSAGYEFVKPKVDRILRSLESAYGFAKEHGENIVNNARYRGVDPNQMKAEVDELLSEYATAHAELPVYNEAHRLAQEAAVSLGRQDFETATNALRELKKHLGSRDEWVRFAREGIDEAASPIPVPEDIPALGMFGEPLPPKTNAVEDWWNGVKSGAKNKRSGNVDVNTLDNPIAKLIVKLRQARPLNKEQAEIYRLERGRRAGSIANAEGTGQEWAKNVKASLMDKYEKVRFEPLELRSDEFDQLLDGIKDSALGEFEQARAVFALEKVMRGAVPQRNEIRTLSSIFTHKLTRDLNDPNVAQDVTAQLVNELYRKKPLTHKFVGGTHDLQRAIMSSGDMSAPLRQGGTGVFNKEWWTSWDDMFKAWGSEKAAKAIDDSIRLDPDYETIRKAGLSLTDPLTPGGVREEGFGSAFAEKYYPLVKRSERAYSAFLNKFRFDLTKRLMKEADKTGYPDPNLGRQQAMRKIVDLVNTTTGRADMAKFEKYADALHEVIYAPRLQASRIKMLEMLTPKYYINQPSYIRKQALKSVLSVASITGITNGVGYMAGGKLVSELRSSDFGKVRFGNTRIDPGIGELQYLTLLARMMRQSSVSGTGRVREFNEGYQAPNSYKVLAQFIENKASPQVSLVIKGLQGEDPGGNPFNMPIEVSKTFIPMISSDLMDIFQKDADLMPEMPPDPRALSSVPLTFFGMGSQTYPEK